MFINKYVNYNIITQSSIGQLFVTKLYSRTFHIVLSNLTKINHVNKDLTKQLITHVDSDIDCTRRTNELINIS